MSTTLCPHPLKRQQMNDTGWNQWSVDDDHKTRQRNTKADTQRGQTERIQCRADAFIVRRVDEIVASRLDPALKTRSDVIQDALDLWLEDWDKRYPDGATGELSYQTRLEAMTRKRERRTNFMEKAEKELDGLQADGDSNGLSTFLQTLLLAQGDFKDDAPSSYLQKLENMIQRAQRLLAASRAL